MSRKIYRRYPTGLKLAYATGILTNDKAKHIPGSTRYRWKHLSATDFWIPDNTTFDSDNLLLLNTIQENEKLKQLLRVAVCMLLIYKKLLIKTMLKRDSITSLQHIIARIIKAATPTMPHNALWKWMPFSYKQWSAWTSRKMCRASLLHLCRKQHPFQLTKPEQLAIIDGCNEPAYQHWSLCSIYYQLMRDGKLHCSISTFYKYCRLLHITCKKQKKQGNTLPVKADAPLKILHMDVTIYRTQDRVKHYIYVIRDNYSRAILACQIALQYSSAIARDTLETVLIKYQLMDKHGILITDNGSENKGCVTDLLKKPGLRWRQLIAQVDIVQSNSMVEAANKIIKHYLYRLNAANTQQLITQMKNIQTDTGNTPMSCLYGYTPNEVLAGAIPDKHLFTQKIAAARLDRVKNNQQIFCVDTC